MLCLRLANVAVGSASRDMMSCASSVSTNWTDRVHPNPMLSKVKRHRARHPSTPALEVTYATRSFMAATIPTTEAIRMMEAGAARTRCGAARTARKGPVKLVVRTSSNCARLADRIEPMAESPGAHDEHVDAAQKFSAASVTRATSVSQVKSPAARPTRSGRDRASRRLKLLCPAPGEEN